MKAVLSIAGSDSSGGAGIQADIKTIAAHKLFAETAITAITAQNNPRRRRRARGWSRSSWRLRSTPCFDDIRPDAVKIGMVSSAAIIEAVAERLAAHGARNVVVDPVMVATSGARLIDEDAVAALRARPAAARGRRHTQHPRGRGAWRVSHRRRGRDGARRPPAARDVRRGRAREGRPRRERRERRAGPSQRHGAVVPLPRHRHGKHPRHRLHAVVGHRVRAGRGEGHGRGRGGRQGRTSPARWPLGSTSGAAAAPSTTCGHGEGGRPSVDVASACAFEARHPEKVRDVSGSSGALTVRLDADDGCYYLKSGEAGSLRREHEALRFFHPLGLAPEALGYESGERDRLLMRPLRVRPPSARSSCRHPDRLARALGRALRDFHDRGIGDCPFSNSAADMLARVERNHRARELDEVMARAIEKRTSTASTSTSGQGPVCSKTTWSSTAISACRTCSSTANTASPVHRPGDGRSGR